MERIIIGDVIYSLRYIFFSSVVRIVDLIIFFLSFFGSFFFFFSSHPHPFIQRQLRAILVSCVLMWMKRRLHFYVRELSGLFSTC